MATVRFEISDGLTFVRWQARAGYVENGQFIVTDGPGERTGEFGKWHVSAGNGSTAFPHNGQQIPAQAETSQEVPPGPRFCVQCLVRVTLTAGPVSGGGG